MDLEMKDGGAMISASRNNPPKDTELDAYDYKQLCERAGMEYKDAIANEFTKYDLARIIRGGHAKGGVIYDEIEVLTKALKFLKGADAKQVKERLSILQSALAFEEKYLAIDSIDVSFEIPQTLQEAHKVKSNGQTAEEYYKKWSDSDSAKKFIEYGRTFEARVKNIKAQTREFLGDTNILAEAENDQYKIYLTRFLGGIAKAPIFFVENKLTGEFAQEMFWMGEPEPGFPKDFYELPISERAKLECQYKIDNFYKKNSHSFTTYRASTVFNIALSIIDSAKKAETMDKQYHALVAELEKKNVPCRVKLTDREIAVETGRDAPDSLDNKISSAASKIGIKNLGLCAETSESGIKSTSIAGGPKDYYQGKKISGGKRFINASLYRESGGNIEFGEGGMLYIGEQKWNVGDNVNLNFKSTWRGKRLYTTPTNRAIINKGDGYEVKNPTRIPSVMFNGRKFKTIAEAREAVLDYYKIDRITGKGKDPDYGNNSGGVELETGGLTEPEITEYKGYEIMYSPHFKRWFANDEEFTSLPAAKKYIDDGAQLSASTINAYRHGAFAVGGAMHTDVLAQIKKDLESFRPQGEDGDVYEYGKNGFSSNFRYLGNWVDDEENSAEFEDPNSDEYDPGWREDNDNRIWAPGEYKRFKEMFVAWAKQYNWFDKVKLSVQTSEKDSCEFIIEIAEPKSYPPTSVSGLIITDKLHKEGIAYADRPDRATTETSDAKDIEVLTDQLEALSAALKYLKGADAKAVETNLLIINSALAALQPKKVIWEGKERLVKSIAKVGKEEKYEIELDNGKTIWTNKATIAHHKAITKNIEELRQELSELNREYWAYPESRRHEQVPRNLKVDIEKKEKEIRAEEAKYAVGGEISGVTTVKYEDDGETLLYGTKNNQTRVSVKGLSKEDIKEEYEFEKMMYDKSVKGLPEEKLGAARIQNLLHASLKEKKDALDMVRRIEKNIEVMQKIVLPFYEKHLVEDDPHYIEYLDKDNNFRQTKKEFKSFEEARDWGRKNLENFNIDMIRMIRATGGEVLKHKSIPTLSIELLEQTNNGWKVKETDPKGIGKVRQGKTAFYSNAQIKDLFNASVEVEFRAKTVTLKGDDTPYRVIADKGDKYIVVIEEKLDLWNNATPLERAEYYEEWIPKSEFNEA